MSSIRHFLCLALYASLQSSFLVSTRAEVVNKEKDLFHSPQQGPKWKLLVEAMDLLPIWQDFGLVVGDSNGQLFSHYKGDKINATSQIPIASSSKWFSAMAIFKQLDNGVLSLDVPVHEYIPYWTSDVNDPRSRVTLRSLLSFTSCYTDSAYLNQKRKLRLDGTDACTTFQQCTQELYDTTPLSFEPRTRWDYNEIHLQFAGAAAEYASNKTMPTLLQELLDELDMSNSYYENMQAPMLADGLVTTGNDYEKFMRACYTSKIVPMGWVRQMEASEKPYPQVQDTSASFSLAAFVGAYGFTEWFECPLNTPWTSTYPRLRDECYSQMVHSSPGLYGYWPLIDRKHEYWMQLVYKGGAAIATIEALFVRLALKPIVDLLVLGKNLPLIGEDTKIQFDELWRQVLDTAHLLGLIEELKKLPALDDLYM